jgi:hypothetical protein
MERKRKIKDGHIVVDNPLFQEPPQHEVTVQSGRTLYRFTGSYDGERSLPFKVFRLIEREQKKDVDEMRGRYNTHKAILYWQTARR